MIKKKIPGKRKRKELADGPEIFFFMLMNEGPNDLVCRLLVNKRKREVVANICGIEGYRVRR